MGVALLDAADFRDGIFGRLVSNTEQCSIPEETFQYSLVKIAVL